MIVYRLSVSEEDSYVYESTQGDISFPRRFFGSLDSHFILVIWV